MAATETKYRCPHCRGAWAIIGVPCPACGRYLSEVPGVAPEDQARRQSTADGWRLVQQAAQQTLPDAGR